MQDKKQTVSGKKGTFLINVHYCQNSTWQGYVVWAEKNKKEYFRSALELMKLIDNALEVADSESVHELEKIEMEA